MRWGHCLELTSLGPVAPCRPHTGCAKNYAKSATSTLLCILCNTTVAGGDYFVSAAGVCTQRTLCTANQWEAPSAFGPADDRTCGA